MNRTQIINNIIEKKGYKNYLEIGVGDGLHFNSIKCSNKTGVDPGIEWDGENVAKYKITSDEFFNIINSNTLYDFIFIDGLHLSYQVEKDIINSLKHLSMDGMIMLHDCNPFMYESNHERVIEDYWGQAWNGTVWKTIYKLRSSRNDLKVITIDEDEGLGIITRGNSITIPFDNPYFEYKLFEKNIKESLGLISYEEYMKYL